MNLKDFKKIKLPDFPGVYFFKRGTEILYIGKATSLANRLRSYFSPDLIKTRGPAIVDMVLLSQKIDFQKTDSVLEAMILESSLIKKHKPKYNTKEKDDKSYNYVVITDEKYPRVLLARQREVENNLLQYKTKCSFGPFTNQGQLREAMRLIQKIFPFFDNKKPIEKMTETDKKRISLNFEMGIYPDISSKDAVKNYKNNIKNIVLFFQGKKKKILNILKKQMGDYSKKREFEKANQIKKTIFALNHINDIALLSKEDRTLKNSSPKGFRIESYDIAHTGGFETVGAMVVSVDGELQKAKYKKFIIRQAKKNDDYGALKEILQRRFKHQEWQMPDLIVVDGGQGQRNTASNFLKAFHEFKKIALVSVVKNEKHKPKNILGPKEIIQKFKKHILEINAETHRFAIAFHKKRRDVIK